MCIYYNLLYIYIYDICIYDYFTNNDAECLHNNEYIRTIRAYLSYNEVSSVIQR